MTPRHLLASAAALAIAWSCAAPIALLAQTDARDVLLRQELTVSGDVIDASTGLAVAFPSIRGTAARAGGDAAGHFRIVARTGDTLHVRRLGFRERAVVVAGPTLRVALVPLAARMTTVHIAAADQAPAGRLIGTREVAELRVTGVASTSEAVASLPFVAARSARGELSLSMRGSRSEQVVVTLDGMPLNDPSTGRADVADLPLAALGALASAPGADPVGAGPGASGGVVALTSDTASLVAISGGSYGRQQLEGAWSARAGDTRLRMGASLRRAENDFPFRNTSAATGFDSLERRANDDERRASAFVSAALPRVHLFLLASEAEQGMAGPMNVHVYDEARARQRRLFARAETVASDWTIAGGVRAFGLAYRDPSQPSFASNADALSVDVTAARGLRALALRVGAGVDRASGTGIERQVRPRGFAALGTTTSMGAWRARAGFRADALSGERMQPSFDAGVERAGRIAPFARVAQAFRAPTLYDLYFASPQRVLARTLQPERVTLDAEAGVRAGSRALQLSGSAFARRTRDAIVWFPGSVGWSPQNVAHERVEGLEGSATWAVTHAELRAWGGRYRTRLLTGSLVLPTPYVPYSAGGVSGLLHHGGSTLSTMVRVSDRRPFAVAPASRTTELPGAALVDAHLSQQFTWSRARALVTVGAENVGNVAWQSVRGYPVAGRTWSAGLTIMP